MADLSKFEKAWADTAPSKVDDLSDETLHACYHYFSESHQQTTEVQMRRMAFDRMNELRAEIVKRQTERQHSEAMILGHKTLLWAKIGGIAAVIGIIVALATDCRPSKFLRAITSRASPPSSPQKPDSASPSQSPPAATPASETPTIPPTTPEASTPDISPVDSN